MFIALLCHKTFNASLTRFRAHRRIDNLHTKFAGYLFQPGHQFLVFYMIGMIVVKLGRTIRTPRKSPVVCHECGSAAGVRKFVRKEKPIVARQLWIPMLELVGKSIIELLSRAPEEFYPQFPGRLGFCVHGTRQGFSAAFGWFARVSQ